jgi:hypothetical protein
LSSGSQAYTESPNTSAFTDVGRASKARSLAAQHADCAASAGLTSGSLAALDHADRHDQSGYRRRMPSITPETIRAASPSSSGS